MDTIPEQNSHLEAVKQFECPNCGGALEIRRKRTQYVGCQYCGTELDVTHETAQALQKLNDPGEFPPFTKIKLGMEAIFDGVKYMVVGRSRYLSTYKEYWSEYDEGEFHAGYSDEQWWYDEWVMFSELGHLMYLIEDQESFYATHEIVPLNPKVPASHNEKMNLMGGSNRIIKEFGRSTLKYHEGESTYQVLLEETIRFAMYDEKDVLYTTEWRTDANGNPKEIEFFAEHKLKDRTVAKAFGLLEGEEKGASINERLEETAASFDQETVRKRVESGKTRKFTGLLLGVAALICFGFIMYSWFTPSIEKKVSRLSFSELANVGLDPSEMFVASKFPFEVKRDGQIIEIKLLTQLYGTANQWVYVGTEILDEDSVPVQTMEGDFWFESGTSYECDEDGCGNYYWEEAETRNTRAFKAEKAGTYVARTWVQMSPQGDADLTVNVEKAVITRYYWIGMIVFAIGWIFFTASGTARVRRWSQYLINNK
ncbi:MAG: hypothetical protein ACOCZ8_04885 [Bacteroidota bacterium]